MMARPERRDAEGAESRGSGGRAGIAARGRLNPRVDVERGLDIFHGTGEPVSVVGALVVRPGDADVRSALPAAKAFVIVPRRFEEERRVRGPVDGVRQIAVVADVQQPVVGDLAAVRDRSELTVVLGRGVRTQARRTAVPIIVGRVPAGLAAARRLELRTARAQERGHFRPGDGGVCVCVVVVQVEIEELVLGRAFDLRSSLARTPHQC